MRDVFRQQHMQTLRGSIGIGHVRYPTAGSSGAALAQPFYVNSPYGIALAHNGNLTNSEQLTRELFQDDLRHLNTDSDSEVLLNVFAHEMQTLGKLSPSAEDIFTAVSAVHQRCRGGYAAVGLVVNYGCWVSRPAGYPATGRRRARERAGYGIHACLESVALDVLGFTLINDVAPGEAVFIDMEGRLHRRQCARSPSLRPCIFEHVYFARPDSLMDEISVYKTRMRQGEALGKKIRRLRPDLHIDVIIPIPDTSRIAAQSMAHELGIKFREG